MSKKEQGPPLPMILQGIKGTLDGLEQIERERLDRERPKSLLPDDYVSSQTSAQLRALAMELAKRKIEGLRLYEPLPVQSRFHASKARTRLARGSNRSGKTLCAAVEVARAVTGQDPFDKYPKQNGRAYCVARDLGELGQVMWPKLGKPGAFKIIRDEVTNEWRAYRPWDPRDHARRRDTKPAPHLIPPRMIKEIGWHNKKLGQPKMIRLYNGWEISFFSSEGVPPHGADIDLFFF